MRSLGNLPVLTICLVTALYLIGCSGSSETSSGMGTLVVKLSDAPFPIDLVEEANVKIDKIEARKKNSEGNPFITLSEDEHTYNLLDLQNGVTADLVEIDVPAGEYDLIRLYVSEAGIVLTDETPFDLTIPSGAQTGIKVFLDPPITVVGGLTSELLLDFDVSQSFVVQGNPDTPAGINGFHFKPVIRAANLSTAGQVTGIVKDDLGPLPGVLVSIDLDPDPATAITDEIGEYTLVGIPQGTYTVNASMTGYEPASVDNVQVVAGNVTEVDFDLMPE